jgi:hypothetical protein
MIDFHNTVMGRAFIESTMPRIATALERLATVGEKLTKDDLLAVSSELNESEHDKVQRALVQVDDIVKGIDDPATVKAAAVAAQRLLRLVSDKGT